MADFKGKNLFLVTFFGFLLFVLQGCGANSTKPKAYSEQLEQEITSSDNESFKMYPVQKYPKIERKDHPSIIDIESINYKIKKNHISISAYVLDRNGERKIHILKGKLDKSGKSYLNNSTYPSLKATVLCIDLDYCAEIVVDFYLLPSRKRVRQFIIEREVSKEKKEPKLLVPIKVEVDEEYIKDDTLIEGISVEEKPHVDDEEVEKGYVGVKPDDDFFKEEAPEEEVPQKEGEEQPSKETNKPEEESPSSDEVQEDANLPQEEIPSNNVVTPFSAYTSDGGDAIHFYTKGRLPKHSTRIPSKGDGFRKINKSSGKNYGTGFLIDFLTQISTNFKAIHPDTELYINSLSNQSGGKVGRHKSHQNGLDVDISYLPGPKWRFKSVVVNKEGDVLKKRASLSSNHKPHPDLDVERNLKFFKMIVDTGVVNRIFVNHNLKTAFCLYSQSQGAAFFKAHEETLRRMRTDSYHHDHFHLRLKCHENFKRCKPQRDPKPGHGCMF